MELSLIIPLYNEAEVLPDLLERSIKALEQISDSYELIAVDDGSMDQTLNLLLDQKNNNNKIKIIQLSRNFGHQAAYTAGLTKANGRFVALMDGDLQDPPEVLVQMYDKIKHDQIDVVFGKRVGRSGSVSRGILNKLFHKTFSKLSGLSELQNVGNFSMMNRSALEALLKFGESIRYLPGIRSSMGFKQDFIAYQRQDRSAGVPKMGLGKLLTLSSDAIFSFSKVPIRLCLYLGLFGILVFFIAGVYTLIAKLAGFALFGWSSTVLSIYFLGSIQLTFLGVIGEYVYRIYKESQKRPLYLIKEFYD